MKLFAVCLATVVFTSSAGADCPKWNSAISMCQTNPSTCASNAPPATFGQWRWYYNKLYRDDYQSACEMHYRYEPGGTYKNALVVGVLIDPSDPEAGVGCQVDANGNNVIDSSEQYWHSILYLDHLTREAMCERTPNGPYKDLPNASIGTPGATFDSAQRATLRNTNLRLFGVLRSDVGPARPPTIVTAALSQAEGGPAGGEIDVLKYNASFSWIFGYFDDINIPFIGNVWDFANVDHIIPRKDIFGCDCGPNSLANAAIISWHTNIGMSNEAADLRRQAILQRYTLP